MQNREKKYTESAPAKLRAMLALVGMLPLVMTILAVVGVVNYQFSQLSEDQKAFIQPVLLQEKKDEIQHFVQIGQRAVAETVRSHGSAEKAKQHALEMLRKMDFGSDHYYFIYDLNGVNLMHPHLSGMENKNHIELQDVNGNFVIKDLITTALNGGGFLDYMWHRPSTNREEKKLGYVELIPQWGWVIGSGLYLDNLKETQELLVQSMSAAREKTRNQILWIASAALLGVAAGGVLINWREQRRADVQLRFMAQQVVRSQENERRRVSRELHDGINQMLAALKFSLESTLLLMQQAQPKMQETLKSSIQMLIECMQDVRRISHNLRPMLLDNMNLQHAVQQIVREHSERTDISAHLHFSEIPELSEECATSIFRVIQEALTNITKHAHAKNIHVQLMHEAGGISLKIRDDGCGFDVMKYQSQGSSEGLGIIGMRERIEMLNGRFMLLSSPGATVIEVSVPYQKVEKWK